MERKRRKTKEEIEEFYRIHTIGFNEEGQRILDCTFEELVEGVDGWTADDVWNHFFDEAEKSWKKYQELHIPPFTLYRSTHGKYGLLNANGYVCGNADLTYCQKKGYEDYLMDDKGNIFEFNPNEELIPIE